MPIDRRIWMIYSDALTQTVQDMAEGLKGRPGPDAEFNKLRDWVARLVERRGRMYSLLLALQPFQPFDHACAVRISNTVNDCLREMAKALEEGRCTTVPLGCLDQVSCEWPNTGGTSGGLQEVFGIDDDPTDTHGDFAPGRVFLSYRYDNGRLLQQIAPHLSSLGVPVVIDPLACVSIVGWISSAEDAVAAYSSMDVMLTALLQSPSNRVVQQTLAYFKQRENLARQTRQRMLSSLSTLVSQNDHESQAFALADAYRRIVEGPVRNYGWALRCLRVGSWSSPPTLTPVREALVAHGGLGQQIAESAILTGLRNGEAHENLEWDGFGRPTSSMTRRWTLGV